MHQQEQKMNKNELKIWYWNPKNDGKLKYKVEETLKREVLETYMTNAEDVFSDV